ncbi:MAG: TMEM175 family protein [Pseudomonadota bacterium]
MLRETVSSQIDHEPDFTWRGEDVTRIENLSDIVFALALGMLVSASSAPVTFSDLEAFLISIVPISGAFLMLVSIWTTHFTFFRRYGLTDNTVIWLNGTLLFLVLYVAYPLRFAADSFFAYVLAMSGFPERIDAMEVGYAEAGIIMGYFAAGYAIIQLIYAAMHAHALRVKDRLALSQTEIVLTRRSVAMMLCRFILGVLVAILAANTVLSGFAGFLIWLALPLDVIVNRVLKVPAAQAETGD